MTDDIDVLRVPSVGDMIDGVIAAPPAVGEHDGPYVPAAAIAARATVARLVRNVLDSTVANTLDDPDVLGHMLAALGAVDDTSDVFPAELDTARYLFDRIERAAAVAKEQALVAIERWFAARDVDIVDNDPPAAATVAPYDAALGNTANAPWSPEGGDDVALSDEAPF